MTYRISRIAAWISSTATLVLLVPMISLTLLTPVENLPQELRPGSAAFLTPASLLAMAVTGALLATSSTGRFTGLVMCAASVVGGVVGVGRSYSLFSLASGHPGLLGVDWLAWLATWGQLPWLLLQAVYLPVLLPGGSQIQRWAWVLWAASLAALVGVVSEALDPELLSALRLTNPMAVSDPNGYLAVVGELSELSLMALALGALASIFVRWKSTTGEHRQQLKWVAAALALLVPALVLETVLDAVNVNATLPWLDAVLSVAYLGVPISVVFAVLRYRLYDIDLVINRTLVYGILVTLISALYLLVVMATGVLLGTSNGMNIIVSALTTALVALAFGPVRERVQRLADRLVYGRKSTPYDALADLSRRAAEGVPGEVLLGDMAHGACDALGVRSTSFWLPNDGELRFLAGWPPGTSHSRPNLALPRQVGMRSLPVRHQGRLLGAMSVTLPPGRSMSGADERLLTAVANQAGLVFGNLGLTVELLARVAELRSSRRRLVAAQDLERRRLERNLHDGAQQLLLGVTVSLRKVRGLLPSDPAAAAAALERLEEDADDALQEMRDLARGLYPPLLTAQGLAAALRARSRFTAIDVRVSAEQIGRYPAEVEEAVYFCCTEAMQNAARHARASSVWIRLQQEGSELVFAVEDDGIGFDLTKVDGTGVQNMRDRIDVVGGTLEICSHAKQGTAVLGRITVSADAMTARPPPGQLSHGSRPQHSAMLERRPTFDG